jgi:hypothetical protein
MKRRIFRTWGPVKYNADGTPEDSSGNQIPWWQKMLHKRNQDRDVEESLGGFEFDGLNRGYGDAMESLYERIPKKFPCGGKTASAANTRKPPCKQFKFNVM